MRPEIPPLRRGAILFGSIFAVASAPSSFFSRRARKVGSGTRANQIEMYCLYEEVGVGLGAGVMSDPHPLRAAENTAAGSIVNQAVFLARSAIDQALSEGSLVS